MVDADGRVEQQVDAAADRQPGLPASEAFAGLVDRDQYSVDSSSPPWVNYKTVRMLAKHVI